MRAREFINEQGMTISIPITITLPMGGGMPQIGTIAAPATDDLPQDPVMVPPLQQSIELEKQQGGRKSQIINQLIKGGFANSPAKNPPQQESDELED